MSVNSSSLSCDSLLRLNFSSIDSYSHFDVHCLMTRPGSSIFITYSITNSVLLFPLCILILYLGLQRWRQQRSTSQAKITSHSDTFTYHMVTLELFGVLGHLVCSVGICRDYVNMIITGFCLFSVTWYGEVFLHLLTCVERYLAVVHPITYLSLRRERGIRIRNISIGCVWLLSFGGVGLMMLKLPSSIVILSLLILSVIIISFCSISVLCVLIHPGPGDQQRGRERVDQRKRRAFYTITAILGTLMVKCAMNLVWAVLKLVRGNSECVSELSQTWFNLPGSLVLPLLFVQRTGTLAWCKTRPNEDMG